MTRPHGFYFLFFIFQDLKKIEIPAIIHPQWVFPNRDTVINDMEEPCNYYRNHQSKWNNLLTDKRATTIREHANKNQRWLTSYRLSDPRTEHIFGRWKGHVNSSRVRNVQWLSVLRVTCNSTCLSHVRPPDHRVEEPTESESVYWTPAPSVCPSQDPGQSVCTSIP